MRRAVFLDRDGVLNRSHVIGGKPYAPRRLADFRLLPGTRGALTRLKAAGWLLVVVTNQPDIANGLVAREVVEAMHARLRERLPIDDIRMCPHRQDEGCACRKPEPGMILSAADDYSIDIPESYMIGDRYSDIQAANRAGCRGILIDRGYSEPASAVPMARASNLSGAVDMLFTHSVVGAC